MTSCYFQPFAGTPCSGPLMRCHVLAQRTLKREHSRANPRVPPAWFTPSALTHTDLRELLDDPRNWRPGCWRHHQHVDGPWGQFPIPDSAREFAAEFELVAFLPVREVTGQMLAHAALTQDPPHTHNEER